MNSGIKKIQFQKKQHTQSFFDRVALSELLKMQPHDHSQFEHHKLTFFVLIFITEGSGKHSINFHDIPFKKGTIFAIRPDSIHKFYPSRAEGDLLVFTEDFILNQVTQKRGARIFQLFNEQLASPKQQLELQDFNQIKTHIDAIKTEFHQVQDDFSSDMIRGLLHLTFTQLLRVKSLNNHALTNTKYLNLFLKFQKLVEAQYQEQQSIASYADQLCITPRTLNNVTHSIVGKSAKTVVNDILFANVKSLLINSDQNITQIAYATGFQETSHLSKSFKKHSGMTPKQFKEHYG